MPWRHHQEQADRAKMLLETLAAWPMRPKPQRPSGFPYRRWLAVVGWAFALAVVAVGWWVRAGMRAWSR
ncbi:MAG: hypothetical protein Q6L50_05970 [Gloeomargarita sp. GMQP_bins_120]